MSGAGEQLGFVATYWGFALTLAGGFYAAVSWFGKHHLSQNSKDTLTLWLWGEYDSTWSHHFCNLFDAVFGSRHLSWRCFLRSSLASVLAVVLLYVLFAEILGVMGDRAQGDLSLWQAMVFGAAINIVPDYVSLFETRWLLKRFERVKSVLGQLGVLFADAVFTGAIIWLGINAFQLWRGDAPLTAIEMLALFSVFSLFFYSTFLTSVWAWLYCLSTWFMRLFSRSTLTRVLDVEAKPVAQVALVGAVVVFVVALILMPVLKTDERRQASAFDQMLCSVFGGKLCLHIVRFSKKESQAFESMLRFCENDTDENCHDRVTVFFKGDENQAASIWQKSCDGGYARGCRAIGWMYAHDRGVARDDDEAVRRYQQACDGGDAGGCANLGLMYSIGSGVPQDDVEAARRYQQACDSGAAIGCASLGWMYGEGRGVPQDDVEAVRRYQQACDDDYARGCVQLGWMYSKGRGVPQDDIKAAARYQQACEGGEATGCFNLGVMYKNGRGAARDGAEAVSLYRRACEMGLDSACGH